MALLRQCLFNAAFLLLDEPFGALDALTRLSLQMWLLELWQTFHSSVLFITHDVREAILLSDRIYVLSARPARVLRVVEVRLPRPRRQETGFGRGGAVGAGTGSFIDEGARTMRLRRLAGYGPAFVLAVALLALWQLSVQAEHISSQVLPAPIAALQVLFREPGHHLRQ